jgi:steroid delta-isomerase-like uncharacterized protein
MAADLRKTADTIYEVLTKQQYDRLSEVFTEDYVEHEILPGSTKTGLEALKEALSAYHSAFSNLRFELLHFFTDGTNVCCRVQMTGTHTGELMGMPASGHQISIEGCDIGVVAADGRCREHWGFFQESQLMAQIATVPQQASVDLTQGATTKV